MTNSTIVLAAITPTYAGKTFDFPYTENAPIKTPAGSPFAPGQDHFQRLRTAPPGEGFLKSVPEFQKVIDLRIKASALLYHTQISRTPQNE
ncbi:MAG: hypothetical protein IMZ53_02735 [Thermoplasmata archaeon]|nr:hypothetical protein [Thermoplasmata archaeon]